MSETALSIVQPMDSFTIEEVKKYITPGATDKELFLFCQIARAYGLNPVKREIHWVKYGNNPGEAVVGYETYLKRAEASGQLDWWKAYMGKDGYGDKAVIEIKRRDRSQPFVWDVYRKEFDKGKSTWNSMPSFMLRKVAIAQGFRLCFPDVLGGMPYTREEMTTIHPGEQPIDAEVVEQIPVPQAPEPPTPAEMLITEAQRRKMFAIMKEARLTKEQMSAVIEERYGLKSSKEMTKDQAADFIDHMEKLLAMPQPDLEPNTTEDLPMRQPGEDEELFPQETFVYKPLPEVAARVKHLLKLEPDQWVTGFVKWAYVEHGKSNRHELDALSLHCMKSLADPDFKAQAQEWAKNQ